MLKGWFKDYNKEAPHSGLGMMSPLEYKKLTEVSRQMETKAKLPLLY